MSGQTEPARQILPTPKMPEELWMLWTEEGDWLLSYDDAPRGETCLVAFSEREALAAAEHQEALYDVKSIPVRVK